MLPHEKAQARAPLSLSEIPSHPRQTIGSDLFQVQEEHYLLNIDYYSKWVHIVQVNELINCNHPEFRKQLADFGQPQVIRSDNSPQYNNRV